MKNTCLIIFFAVIIGMLSSPVTGEDASVQLGEKLFNDTALGGSKNPASCSSCHPGGKGLENSGERPNLTEMINSCIEKPLKGQKIDADSMEMKSLVLYIKSLGR